MSRSRGHVDISTIHVLNSVYSFTRHPRCVLRSVRLCLSRGVPSERPEPIKYTIRVCTTTLVAAVKVTKTPALCSTPFHSSTHFDAPAGAAFAATASAATASAATATPNPTPHQTAGGGHEAAAQRTCRQQQSPTEPAGVGLLGHHGHHCRRCRDGGDGGSGSSGGGCGTLSDSLPAPRLDSGDSVGRGGEEAAGHGMLEQHPPPPMGNHEARRMHLQLFP